MYPIYSAWVLDATTLLPNEALKGQQVQVVTRNTTTPYPIFTAAGDPIPSSLVTVTQAASTPTVYVDTVTPETVYLDWYDSVSGSRGPIWFEEVSRESAMASADSSAASATSALASENAATATAEGIAAFQAWFELGQTTRNVVLDPRATNAAYWSSVNVTATELPVTGATDGPLLPDGSRATTYMRYTMTANTATVATSFGYSPPSENVGLWPISTPVAVAIYIRSTVALPAVAPNIVQQAPASPWTETHFNGPNVAVPANTWTRVSSGFLSTIEAGAFGARAFVQSASSALLVNGAVVEVALALAAPGLIVVPEHFDGATPSTAYVGNAWTGEPNASVSQRTDMSSVVRSVNGIPGPDVVLPPGGGGITDHNLLSNLAVGDPHTQYLTPTRGNSLFYPRATVDAIVAAAQAAAIAAAVQRGNHTGFQGIGSITGLQAALDAAAGAGAGPDVPRIVIVATGDEPRPADAVVVQWYDGRDPSTPQPVNMGTNDIRILGNFTAGADLIAPSVPTGLTIGSITASGATLTWTASTDNVGVTGYEVRRDGSVSLGVATGLSRAITGLAQNTAHTVAVRARDAAGNWSAWSTEVPFTTSASSDTTAPTVPTGLASSAITGSGFTVTWGAGTDNVGVTGYDWRLNGGAPTTVPADPRSLTLSGLAAETAYTVGIRSRDAAGNTSAYVDLVVTTGAAAAETYNVFGASAPPGTYTWGTDGTPYIVVGQGFRCSATGARAVGGRAWIPTAASGTLPTEATFYLFGPNQGIETTPVQTKVVSTAGATAGSWVEALFDTPQAMGSTEVWMIGVRFTGAGDAGKYPFGSGVRASGSAVPSVGTLGTDLGWIEYGTALNMAFRIGTGSVTAAASNDQGRGIDIIVDLEG